MKELKNYYNKWKKYLFIPSVIGWIILLRICSFFTQHITVLLDEYISNNGDISIDIIAFLINILAPTFSAFALYSFLLRYINEKAWKKKFPQYDISGEWMDKTTYTKKIDNYGWHNVENYIVESPVCIKQTCKSVEITSSIGEKFKWYSLIADWNERGTLEIFYKVEYFKELQQQGYPEERRGFECMDIIKGYEDGERPKKMRGKFWHCISYDKKPMYLGTVTYERLESDTKK